MRMAPGAFFRFLLYSSLYFLPIYQSFSLIIQFYGKGDYFSLISLERFGILLGCYLLRGSIYTAVIAQLLKDAYRQYSIVSLYHNS
jgi:hypothetical protein